MTTINSLIRLFYLAVFMPMFLLSLFLSAQTSKFDQYIFFDMIPDKSCTDTVFNITASSNSGLPILYNIVSGPATISGNKVILTKIDFTKGVSQISILIKASQQGNEEYNAATDVFESFKVKTNFIDSLRSNSFFQSHGTTLTVGGTINLNAKNINGLNYVWTVPTLEKYMSPAVSITNVTTLLSGLYNLNISTGVCKLYNNSININVLPQPEPPLPKEDSSIYVYKIITPNSDQKNDHLFIKNLDKYSDHHLSIFDLWGNMVFQSTNYKKEWPSLEISSGEYYYTLIINSTGKTYSGGILVLKE